MVALGSIITQVPIHLISEPVNVVVIQTVFCCGKGSNNE
jgi:hypothetical protein